MQAFKSTGNNSRPSRGFQTPIFNETAFDLGSFEGRRCWKDSFEPVIEPQVSLNGFLLNPEFTYTVVVIAANNNTITVDR
jgi:hypothetical protein